MSKIKKIAVSTLAAVAVMTSTLSLVASAYSDSGKWNFYSNPHVSHTIENYKLNYYNGGYRAVTTDKGYGGSYNYVDVSEDGTVKAKLTEKGVTCKTFKASIINIDSSGNTYAGFRVQMYAEDITGTTPYNNGEIKLSNMF